MSDATCAACGHPRSNHPYRHRFVGPSLEDDLKDLEAKLAKAVKALRFYAWENEMRLPSDGPWGAGSTDFGKVARATLAEIKGGNDAESNL